MSTYSPRALVSYLALASCIAVALGVLYASIGFPLGVHAQSICITDPFAECSSGGDYGGGGQADPTPVSVVITANPSTILQGQSSVVSWSSANATNCTVVSDHYGTDPVPSYTGPLSGSMVVSPTSTHTYGISCYKGYNGVPQDTASAETVVTVTSTQAPTVTLTATPSSISGGSSSTLTWSSTNATTCTSTSFTTGSATSGSAQVAPSSTTSYSVTCTGAGGSATASATVTVTNTNVCVY